MLSGIQHVITELVGQLRQLPGQVRVTLLLVFRQVDPAQAEIPQHVLDGFTLRFTQIFEVVPCGQFLVCLTQGTVLADFGTVLGQLLQTVLVHLAQVVVVHHAVQV